MKKIILVILSFFCFTLNPLAKEIIINDISYFHPFVNEKYEGFILMILVMK